MKRCVMPQIPLFEPTPVPDYRRENFLTSICNAHILDTVRSWLASDEKMLVICGSEGSGKSHLAHVIMGMIDKGDEIIFGDISAIRALLDTQRGPVGKSELSDRQALNLYILDPVEQGQKNPRQLLDLIEDCRVAGQRLILSGRGSPADWAGPLQDLLTRLEAMPRIDMPEPDEELMRKVIVRQMSARQLALAEEEVYSLADYAAQRLPRTHEAAYRFTRGVDMLALSEKKKPGQAIVRQVIELMEKERKQLG